MFSARHTAECKRQLIHDRTTVCQRQLIHDRTTVCQRQLIHDRTTVCQRQLIHYRTTVCQRQLIHYRTTVCQRQLIHDRTTVCQRQLIHDRTTVDQRQLIHDRTTVCQRQLIHDRTTVCQRQLIHDRTTVCQRQLIHDRTSVVCQRQLIHDRTTVDQRQLIHDRTTVDQRQLIHDRTTVDQRQLIYDRTTVVGWNVLHLLLTIAGTQEGRHQASGNDNYTLPSAHGSRQSTSDTSGTSIRTSAGFTATACNPDNTSFDSTSSIPAPNALSTSSDAQGISINAIVHSKLKANIWGKQFMFFGELIFSKVTNLATFRCASDGTISFHKAEQEEIHVFVIVSAPHHPKAPFMTEGADNVTSSTMPLAVAYETGTHKTGRSGDHVLNACVLTKKKQKPPVHNQYQFQSHLASNKPTKTNIPQIKISLPPSYHHSLQPSTILAERLCCTTIRYS
ncbi:hypothetical protein MAR_033596 [Mya arenaria]|uniref:Uncharacterized protein n=1 Tax=Mya arenaria TaxID=6604 RepID=A0ABY7GC33_MYAAR|nr:hypothetical protein MAR_033596 [Mya arenaria]